MEKELSLFYDYEEYTIKGEGFYPQLSIPRCEKFLKKNIFFKLENNIFYQYSGPAISGFYEKQGEEVLKALNKQHGANPPAEVILNSGGRQVHPTDFERSTFKIITKKRCYSF